MTPVSDPRFHVDAELRAGTTIELPERVAHHAARVRRLADGASIVVFDGRGGEYAARLADGGKRAELLRHDPIERESPVAITLVQAWIAVDKLEWLVEKAVEFGVAHIAVAPTRRSVVQLDGARLARRVERLREIGIGACCQCGRNRVPPVEAFADLRSALAAAAQDAAGLLLAPDAPRTLVEAVPHEARRIAILVGPEGGLAPDEREVAASLGYQAARLGPRVLRTEAAGLAALATLQASVGDFR